MNYYEGYRARLVQDAKLTRNDVRDLMEDNSGSEEDMALFYELLRKNRKSEYVYTEHIRARHMLLKSGLDSGQ
ncbi:hypothetical protein HBO12_20270 [Pseudomonas sp. WS 5059]|jgi:hypothetical protein|uniref:hypothetical protein n=1 Tax=unclassified Pseudomonas TaxID=196821 RepID=UPI0014729945|nr:MULTISPECIES: hypothetical protein [unclassified Pseudomonas]NMX63339.1 hypothetical protein [Pseudomonas sp. WS 5079]NMX68959.1 hypothetical protein [Pseudomonas sp. WS 5111]NMX88655.1 hypothetical protein [Pseudomonas sp. WS 5010]NMY05307.1 hypothetical protein [Pseudomonas sp. WS 5059]NMY29462.1 hypothetical protein [Pseudomonas sp. WS 5021]